MKWKLLPLPECEECDSFLFLFVQAYHFFLIAQRQLYNGEAEASLKTEFY